MALGRAFNVLWGANAASNLADGLAFVSIPLLASSLTDDSRWVAGLATVYAVVRLAVALPVGVWVDRVNRRTLLALANILRGGTLLGLAVCVYAGVGGLAALYAAYAVVGALESAADNAALSIVPDIVRDPDLDGANGRISAAQLVADEFAGPPLGGFLFAVGASVPLFAMGGLWAFAGALALALPVRRSRIGSVDVLAVESVTMWREALEGAHWLAHNRIVGGLALIGGLTSVGYMVPFSILVLFAQRQLGLGDVGYGAILAVSALGGLVGSFVTTTVRSRLGYRWTIVASLTLGSISLLALGFTTNGAVAAALLAAYILHAVVWGICATTLRQRLVPDQLRGRVNAASRVLGLMGLALGSALGGPLAVIQIGLPVLVGGLVFALCAGVAAVLIRDDALEARPASPAVI